MRRSLMRGLMLVALCWPGVVAGTAYGVQTQPTGTAETAAQAADLSWLKLVDAAKYSESWKAAAKSFQAAITMESWVRAVQAAREPLGAVQARTLAKATHTKTLPGAPDGDYVVAVFTTSFAHKAEAQETVTATHEQDGSWRVSGYYVK